MPKHLADQIEAVSACDGHGCETVPQVVQAHVLQPGALPDTLPGLLEADEMPSLQAREDVRVAFYPGNFRESFKRGGSQGDDLGPGLGVGQTQTTAFGIHVLPLQREDFGFPRASEDQ